MGPGDPIGDWVVEERLGKGGSAEVYRCNRGGDHAAVKRLRASRGADPQARRRLAREAQILMSLDHPGIVRIREVHVDADPPWIVMDLIPGRSCSGWIRRGPAAPGVVEAVAARLIPAIAHLHTQGITHRDIKPANVIASRGETLGASAVLVDFGLALDPSLERLSAQGVRLGTFTYMPPEWVSAEAGASPLAWDVYGAGQLLFELAVGHPAFNARAPLAELVQAKLSRPCLDPGERVPEALRRLIRELTAADPASRPADGVASHARMLTLGIGD